MFKIRTEYLVYFFFLILLSSGCNIFDSSEGETSPAIPDGMVLYTTVFGQGEGVWVFNPQNLEVKDTIVTGSSWSINLSPTYRNLYSAWRDNEISKAYSIDVKTKEIVNSRTIWNQHIELDRTGKRLISMGNNYGIQVLDSQTFEILYEGEKTIRNFSSGIIASPVKDEFYALIYKEDKSGVVGLMVFDLESFSIKSIIPITNNENRRQNMEGTYIDISPDGKYVYATVFNWQGGGGYGSFHVIDLEKEEQIFESVCPGFAWLGVSPDGRHVYLSGPAGTPFNTIGISYEFPPTNQILQYDTRKRKIDLFADGGTTFGLTDDLLITSSLVVAPDSRSLFIRVLGSGTTPEGKVPALLHVDIKTKELITVYELPPDSDGFVRAWMHQLKIGYRPI